MSAPPVAWDYLVLTASNALQAGAYEFQLNLRRQYGLLPRVREALVVADLEDRRIGSGGSTLLCLLRILERERLRHGRRDSIAAILRQLRILIVHAGGDSRRLPAYGPCGKIFVPLPAAMSESPLPVALFDRLVPDFLALPPGVSGRGQVVVAAGDALVLFDAAHVSFSQTGLTALGCYAKPEEASRHGVFSSGENGVVSVYLQKPSIAEQREKGAIGAAGLAALDVGVMSLDAEAAESLLDAFGVAETPAALLSRKIDLYREICCAMGTAASLEHYLSSVRASGSTWTEEELARVYPILNRIPLHVQVVPSCRFLHFGSTRQLIESGQALAGDGAASVLSVNNCVAPAARIDARDAWVEGCRISADLQLAGQNVLVGVDVDTPLSLPLGACLEVLRGRSRGGADVWFVRCYGIADTFKHDSRFCGRPMADWIEAVGMADDDVWPDAHDGAEHSLWTARVFPAETSAGNYRRWLWMYTPEVATAQEIQAFRGTDRYSAEEIAFLADQAAFHSRRLEIWETV